MPPEFSIVGTLAEITETFAQGQGRETPFKDAGLIINRKVHTLKVKANYSGPYTNLGDVLLPEKDVPEEFFVDCESLQRWKYLKGRKSEMRQATNGHEYHYSEGEMTFPDPLDKPSRTIITGEGGSSPSRFKHIVQQTPNGRYRRLTPVELERLDMFPDNHTAGKTDQQRAFFLGNALVVGIIQKIGEKLYIQAKRNGDIS